MPGPQVHFPALLLTVSTLALIASGPAGVLPHRILSGVVILLALAAAALGRHRWAYLNLVIILIQGGLGRLTGSQPWAAVVHDVLAPLSLSLAAALATVSSTSYRNSRPDLEDSGKPSLGALTRFTPYAIAVQILFGALFRHHLWGAMPHIFGAMIAGGVIMFAGISVVILPGAGRALQWAAGSLLGITFLQFLLGIYAYLSRIEAAEGTVTPLLSAITVSHIATGALTMGLSVVLALLVSRNVRPEGAPVAVNS